MALKPRRQPHAKVEQRKTGNQRSSGQNVSRTIVMLWFLKLRMYVYSLALLVAAIIAESKDTDYLLNRRKKKDP